MTRYPDDADGNALEQMRNDGIEMTRPLLIEFFIAVPDQLSASSVEAALIQHGYESEIVFDEGEPLDPVELQDLEASDLNELAEEFGPSWTVSVGRTMIPEYAEIVRLQSEFEKIACPFGGHADGWGVMIDDAD